MLTIHLHTIVSIMNWVVGIFSLFLIAMIGYFLKGWLLKKPKTKEDLPYKLNPRFFTKSEFAFYQELKKQVGDRYAIFPKVRLADFIEVDVDKYKDKSRWYAYWNKIKSKHLDFLLCDPETLRPVVAVELNGRSHESEKMKQRDAFIAKLYESTSLKFVTVQTTENFSISIQDI